jgi:hypothetical protein
MFESKENINLLGSILANINNLLLIFIFLARINHYPRTEYFFGLIFIITVIPLAWMFIKAFEFSQSFIYFLQLGLMIIFILVELILDYILKLDFRHNRNIVIPYVTLFYASFGGMIGIASQSGKIWTIVTILTFLIMVGLSLSMHFKTGT